MIRFALPIDRSSPIGNASATFAVDADVGLDVVLQLLRGRVARLLAAVGELGAHLDVDRQFVEVAGPRHFERVVRLEFGLPQDQFLDLRREQVHAADDQHVVRAAGDLLDAPHRPRGRRQQARQVARAIADHRQRFLGERREDQFALLAFRQHLAGLRIDDLRIEVVLPDRQPVLGLDALLRDPGTDDLRQAVDVDRVERGLRLDRVAHRRRPRLGAEDADLQRRRSSGRRPAAPSPRRSPACTTASP